MPGRIQHVKEEKGLLYPVWRFRIWEAWGISHIRFTEFYRM